MRAPAKVLLIDSDTDNSDLLVHSMRRIFPGIELVQSRDAVEAMSKLAVEEYDAVVVHRTDQISAVNLITTARKIAPTVVLIAVSGIDRSEAVLAAGADGFLNSHEWARIGPVIGHALELRAKTPAG
jgi:DNA-binding response OmpR family regulator